MCISVVVPSPAIVEFLDTHIFTFMAITKLVSKLDVPIFTSSR